MAWMKRGAYFHVMLHQMKMLLSQIVVQEGGALLAVVASAPMYPSAHDRVVACRRLLCYILRVCNEFRHRVQRSDQFARERPFRTLEPHTCARRRGGHRSAWRIELTWCSLRIDIGDPPHVLCRETSLPQRICCSLACCIASPHRGRRKKICRARLSCNPGAYIAFHLRGRCRT